MLDFETNERRTLSLDKAFENITVKRVTQNALHLSFENYNNDYDRKDRDAGNVGA